MIARGDTATPISLAALTILDAGPAGQIRAAADAGWRSVGLRLMPLLASDAQVVGDRRAESEIESLLAATAMSVLEVGVLPIKAEMDWPTISAVVEFSARIGACFLVCPIEDFDVSRRLATFSRLCDLALPLGLRVLVEFNPYSGCKTMAEAVEIVRRSHRANAGLVIDALHLSRSGGHPGDVANVDPSLLDLVHLCDAPLPPSGSRTFDELRSESRTARLLPGEGALWLDDLLQAIAPQTRLSVEAPSARDAHLPAAERARLAREATQRLLARAGTRG